MFVGILNSIILFSSYPGFSFCLGCLLGLSSVISCRNSYIEYGWAWHICQWLPNMATRGGVPFVNFKLPSFNVKCSQKLVNLGKPFLSTILWSKRCWHIFFAGVRWHSQFYNSLLFLPWLFLLSWTFVLVAISYQLQKPIHRIWDERRTFVNDCLKFGNSWRGPFSERQTAFF